MAAVGRAAMLPHEAERGIDDRQADVRCVYWIGLIRGVAGIPQQARAAG